MTPTFHKATKNVSDRTLRHTDTHTRKETVGITIAVLRRSIYPSILHAAYFLSNTATRPLNVLSASLRRPIRLQSTYPRQAQCLQHRPQLLHSRLVVHQRRGVEDERGGGEDVPEGEQAHATSRRDCQPPRQHTNVILCRRVMVAACVYLLLQACVACSRCSGLGPCSDVAARSRYCRNGQQSDKAVKMEELDEHVPPPDSSGCVDLSNRAWVHLDPVLWTMSDKLLVLDLSYNCLETLPEEVGEVRPLRELNVSFNRLVALTPHIGKLRRLKRLLLNCNSLQHLPSEIGDLSELDTLVVSENKLLDVPTSIERLENLKVLKLQSNDIAELPVGIGDLLSLSDIDVSNNPRLAMIPKQLRGDTAMVLWLCRMFSKHMHENRELQHMNASLTRRTMDLEYDCFLLQEKIADLENQIKHVHRFLSAKQMREWQTIVASSSDNQSAAANVADSRGCVVC